MNDKSTKPEEAESVPIDRQQTLPVYDNRDENYDNDWIAPTEDEMATLRRMGDKIPISAWLVAVVELAERFTYYGLTGPWQNYMQNPRGGLRPGALDLGQAKASSLQYFFVFWCYITPIFGAIVADSWLGRYNAICLFSAIYLGGLVVLLGTSVPHSLESGAGFGGLIVTMIILGLGTGGIKSNVSPLIAEQYTETRPRIKILKTGEKVIIDPAVTIQSIYNIFYWCINIGSLSAIATTYLELYIDFWAAYLLPFCVFFFVPVVLWAGKKKYIVRPPKGSILLDAGNAFWIAARNGFRLQAATDQYGEQFIAELQRALVACRVFAFYPAFWLLYGQMNTSFVSMAGTMETHGLPNDFLINLNPISIIIFIPVVEKGLYPALRKLGISFKPITRIFVGFLCIALGMAYAAGIQKYVYMQGPCYDHPLECAASMDGEIPNRAHVALQVPVYVLTGFGEIFAAITGLEYAFTKAPPSMKSFVTAIYLIQNAFGSAIGIGVSTVAQNPHMVKFFAALSGVTVVCGFAFFALFRKHNKTEEEMNRLDADNQEFKPRPAAEIHTAKEKLSEP
ncbi:POT family-domain-containing protein [Pyronema omphalodes]|nr:POT family-domain-containing protein [Pyronema omphalodes]